jgi:hypothetical protein
MEQSLAIAQPKKKGFYRNTTLILAAFSTAFYSRIFCAVTRAPSALNFFHFLTIPVMLGFVLATSRSKDQRQLNISWALIISLLMLFATMTASALLNDAGLINVVFHFLMLGEPFMLLLAIVCVPMSSDRLQRFRNWMIGSSFANMILAFIQWPLLKAGKITAGGLDATDGMAGVFFVSGAGNYVSTTVSIYFGIYYLMFAKNAPLWLRISTMAGAIVQLQLSDSKQVLFALLGGWGLLILTNMKDIRKALTYVIGFVLLIVVFYWCVENVEAFAAFKNYAGKQGAYGPDGEATRIKPIAFHLVPTFYHSPLNWLLGLGPGHTVGRLGGWLLKENWAIFGPLGATTHPASSAALDAYYNSWLALESTMFCPLFGWAGIWGDLGFLGLTAYLVLAAVVWHYICFDNFSKFLLLTVAMFGLIFTQMEEPGYMLYTSALLGLRWHEHQAKLRSNENPCPSTFG